MNLPVGKWAVGAVILAMEKLTAIDGKLVWDMPTIKKINTLKYIVEHLGKWNGILSRRFFYFFEFKS
jgi:hypothetical protein